MKASKQKNTKSHVQLSIDRKNMFHNGLILVHLHSPAGTTFLAELCKPMCR